MTRAGPPAAAVEVFGSQLPVAQRFADLLATVAMERGLIGPREVPRLWERHLLNCAVVADLLPVGVRVVDVGSGAGLPGLVLAIRRPDLQVDLVESLQRRVTFLSETTEVLGLSGSVRVVAGRAEDASVQAIVGDAAWVTARAVAPLDRLVRWCLPLLRPGGRLLAIKGTTAETEVATHGAAITRLGGVEVQTIHCGSGVIAEPTAVVVVRRGETRVGRVTKGRS